MRLTQPKELSLAIGMALVSILIFSINSNAANIEVTVETAGINNNATIDDINNSSSITGNVGGVAINNNGTITYINNSGTITGSWIGINNNGTITGVINNANGTITGDIGINANGPIESIVNFGNITAAVNNGMGILVNHNSVSDITNNGSIVGNRAGIAANYSVNTLANLQGEGNDNGALTLYGVLPTHYNIIINSNVNYGQLAVTNGLGNMAFNIYGYTGQTLTSNVSASSVSNRLYQNVLAGLAGTLSGSSITGTGFSISGAKGSYGGYGYTLVADDSNVSGVWDLFFGASTTDTQSSLASQARRLRSTFNSTMASGNFANMNAYDCNLFDQNNMCISAGGRVTTIDNPSSYHSAAVVVLGYKVSPNIRIGGFLDQSINNNTPTGIQVSNKNPMMGAFAVWNKNADGLGYQLKIANAYQEKDVTTTREVIGSSEAGTGRTDLNTQSYVGELSYAFQYQDSTIVRPYFALRYTNIKQDAYTETAVSTPLSYAKLGDRSTTALMGVKLNHALTPRTNLTASLGIEQDINHQVDKLNATGFADLTSENFNNNIKRTRPVASAGAYYAVAKNQRLSGEVYYQQLPFQSTGSATAYVNYMIGF